MYSNASNKIDSKREMKKTIIHAENLLLCVRETSTL